VVLQFGDWTRGEQFLSTKKGVFYEILQRASDLDGKVRNSYKILVGKPEGKRPLGRPRRGWEDIRVGLSEIGWESVDWNHLAQDRERWRALVNRVLKFRVP
jgi:hypothetical protein